ncbi:MAG: helix-turn-helix transcriptional regulator [Propionicimonas sp.]
MGQKPLTGAGTRYIAGELRAQKSRRKWTLDDIERLTGVDRSTVDRALKGEMTLAVETLIQLCAGMELNLAELVTEAARRR